MFTRGAPISRVKNTFLEFVSSDEDANCGSAVRRTKSSPCLKSTSGDVSADVATAVPLKITVFPATDEEGEPLEKAAWDLWPVKRPRQCRLEQRG
eukprot:9468075-Pyramimonas_sp.AAC.1